MASKVTGSGEDVVKDIACDNSMDIESDDDDESDVKDDINCKHDTNEDGKYYTCCKFVDNSNKILDIIH